MPVSSVAQILLRIFALKAFLQGLSQLLGLIVAGDFLGFSWPFYAAPVFAGIVIWVVSPKLSRMLTYRNDGIFSLTGVSEQQLYSAVFLALGLYFTLTSFAASFNWAHFFVVNKSPDYGFHRELESQPSYYDLTENVMTLAAGVSLMITCKTWARKLAKSHPNLEVGPPPPSVPPAA